ncbi:hypothetical protein IW146_001978 [Coemansia sp. RSA 922]|nr:hypothetical protein IW146_001978 [Coemansia sp. RSA 922]KAJ2431233.1 hypothetical protein GGF41_000637 [Coemansia sp. RSA 2531]
MVSASSFALTLLAAPAALAQFMGGGMVGSESVSSGSYYNSATSVMPGFGGLGYGGMGYGGMGYGGMGYGGLGGYGGYGGYGMMGYGGYGGLGGLGGMGYGYGRGVGIMGASTGGAAIMGPSGSIIVGPQSAGGIYL